MNLGRHIRIIQMLNQKPIHLIGDPEDHKYCKMTPSEASSDGSKGSDPNLVEKTQADIEEWICLIGL